MEKANLGPLDNLDYLDYPLDYEELNGYNNETHASPVLHLVISKFTNERRKGLFFFTSVFHCILQVHSISEGQDKMCMFCTKDAKDKKRNKKVQACEKITFPCLKVMVKFTVDGKDYTSLIHPDSIQARGAYSKVSQLLLLSFASKAR